MSVIAWDGKTLAADKQATDGANRSIFQKIQKLKSGHLIGAVGDVSYGEKLIRWYRGKRGIKAFPKPTAKQEATLIVVCPDGDVYEYESDGEGEKVPVKDKFMAWGSGRDFALGAMEMGADARQAVKVASKHHVECGMGITAFRIGTK